MQRWIEGLRYFLVIFSLVACTGVPGTKDSILPQKLKPMDEIYRDHMTRAKGQKEDPQWRGSLRSEANMLGDDLQQGVPARDVHEATELDEQFPTLPNPTLFMYVYPHLSSSEGVPVPGYTTKFKMYERDQYAMPGEVPTRRGRDAIVPAHQSVVAPVSRNEVPTSDNEPMVEGGVARDR